MTPQVFISHSSSDRKVAITICDALENRGINCWIAGRDVGPGENFQESIVTAIRAAKVMVLVFTDHANNSREIKKELALASQHAVAVIPVRVEDVLPVGGLAYELATRQWIDLFEDWEREIERLAAWTAGVLSGGSSAADASPRHEHSRDKLSDPQAAVAAKRPLGGKMRSALLGGGVALALAFVAVALFLVLPRMWPSPPLKANTAPAASSSSPESPTNGASPAAPLTDIIQAAARGVPAAENALGVKYAQGADGLPRDDAQAVEWYRKAALQGYPGAETNLGDMYLYGRGGLDQSSLEASSWYLKAANQNWPGAQYRLGYLYETGLGTTKDPQRAVALYRSAANSGYPDAENMLGVLYATGGDGLPQDDQQAIDWYRKAGEQGFAKAETNLGDMYFFGHGVERDYGMAIVWYKKAAAQNFAKAQFQLGYMNEKGLGTPQSDQQAIALYRQAAGNGSVDAQRALDRLNSQQ